MSDLISRAAAIEYLMTNMGWHDEDGYEVDDADEKRKAITDLVNGIPAVDVPLRCKGCSFFAPHKHDRGEDSRCTMLNMEVREDDYCSFGAWTAHKG